MSTSYAVVAAVVLTLSAFSFSCGSKDKEKESEQRFMVNVAIPQTFRLSENTYPATKCIPVQFQAVNDLESKDAVALKDAAEVEISVWKSEPENLDAAFYEDDKCSERVEKATIPASDFNPSIKKLYLKSEDEGLANFRFKYGGRSWGGSILGRFTFQKQ